MGALRYLRVIGLCGFLALAGCGGGGGSSSGTGTPAASGNLTGTAATGTAIANATITLVDKAGNSVSTTTDSAGQYSLNTSGLTPPFLVKVVTATASQNGYAAGTTFYSVSADANPSVINVTPLTDLLLRTWYAAQSTPTTVAQAFTNPVSNPPPSAVEVKVIEGLVMDIVEPILVKNNINPAGFDLIYTKFSANGSGFDGVLDKIKPVTYGSGTATLTIDTDSTTTQTTTLATSSGTTQATTDTTDSSTGATSQIVSSVVIPSNPNAVAAVDGVASTLSSIASIINSKGSALAAADIAPYFDANFLDGAVNATEQETDIAQSMAGVTISSFDITRITAFDSTNNLIAVVGTATITKNGSAVTHLLDGKSDYGMWFKKEANGSWLFYGDQQMMRTQAEIWSEVSQGPGGNGWQGQILQLQASVPTSSTTTPCASPYATGVMVSPATSIAATRSDNSAAVTIGSGYALSEDTTVYQDSSGSQCQFDGILGTVLLLDSSTLSCLPGNTISFTPSGGTATNAPSATIPGYTTELINFTNLSSHALSAASLGAPLTVSWTLPVTFPVASIDYYGQVAVMNGSGAVDCSVDAGVLALTATSATITLPSKCHGTVVTSMPSGQPVAAQLEVTIRGTHGEAVDAWWGFN